MIINSSQGDIEVSGDVKEFKTSIDPKNLEFITTLLSSNLYSDPEQSFIREIVSNAWDSHVEAGNTNVPVIIRFKINGYGEKSVTIRDYGTGLSPERFKEVYCNIGSSTKRESNEFIGGFGIGKYSALACSNTVYITSYYKGISYYYLMVKSGNSITTNLLMERPTSEKDGVEVTIKNVATFEPYSKALDYIIFFPNIYVDGAECSNKINTAKLKRFNNFAAASIRVKSKLLLGNVLYPCNKYLLSFDAQSFLNSIENTGIVIKFNVGEINITPNRESVIYNPETIKLIENRIVAAKEELEGFILNRLNQDFDDIKEYCDLLSSYLHYDPISDNLSKLIDGYRINPSDFNTTNITYKGHNLGNCLDILKALLGAQLPHYKGVIYSDEIRNKRLPWSYRDHSLIKSPKILVLNSNARLTEVAKLYLKENYDGYGIMTDISLSDFKKWVGVALHIHSWGANAKSIEVALEGVYEHMMKIAVRLDLNTDEDYLDYKASFAATSKSKYLVKEAILYLWHTHQYREKITFKSLTDAVNYLKGRHTGVVLVNMDVNAEMFKPITDLKGFLLIQARKDIVSYIKELKPSYLIDLDWLIHKDPMLSVIKTVRKYFPNLIETDLIKEVCNNLTDDVAQEFMRIHTIRNTYGESSNYLGLITNANIPIDPYTEYLCQKLISYLWKQGQARSIVRDSGITDSTLTAAVVMKTKAYKISSKAYKRIQNNKLLNVLCRK
jgi:hypothetical protein